MSLNDARGLPVETDRLLIRPMQTEDAAFILELLNEPDFLENIGDKEVRTLEDALGYIQSAGWDNYRKHGFGMNTVELVDTSTRIGICGLLQRETLTFPDVGFAYLAAFHGRGYATEAGHAMVGVARTVFRLPKVCAFTTVTNEASVRVLRKLGLEGGEQRHLSTGGPEIRYFERTLSSD